MGNRRVPETHHDDPEVEMLPKLSRRRRTATAAMVLQRGAQPEYRGRKWVMENASEVPRDGVREGDLTGAHSAVAGEEATVNKALREKETPAAN